MSRSGPGEKETRNTGDTQGQPMMTLADMRRMAGKSQGQVAQAMGVGQARVSHIEESYPEITFPVLLRYVQAIGGRVQYAVPGGTVQATALTQDPAREEALLKRRERTRGDAGRFV